MSTVLTEESYALPRVDMKQKSRSTGSGSGVRRRHASAQRPTLRGLDVVDGDFAGAAVLGGVEGDLLALDKPAQAGALQRSRMDEHVLAAVVRLNEAEAFLIVVEFYGARIHRVVLFASVWRT